MCEHPGSQNIVGPGDGDNASQLFWGFAVAPWNTECLVDAAVLLRMGLCLRSSLLFIRQGPEESWSLAGSEHQRAV